MTDSGDEITTFECVEGETQIYTATLLDEAGNPIDGSVLDALTLTVFQEYTELIVNGRNGQNVNGINGVTVDANGVLTWQLTELDTALHNDALAYEPHMVRFDFLYPTDNRGRHEVRFLVRNLRVDDSPDDNDGD